MSNNCAVHQAITGYPARPNACRPRKPFERRIFELLIYRPKQRLLENSFGNLTLSGYYRRPNSLLLGSVSLEAASVPTYSSFLPPERFIQRPSVTLSNRFDLGKLLSKLLSSLRSTRPRCCFSSGDFPRLTDGTGVRKRISNIFSIRCLNAFRCTGPAEHSGCRASPSPLYFMPPPLRLPYFGSNTSVGALAHKHRENVRIEP